MTKKLELIKLLIFKSNRKEDLLVCGRNRKAIKAY